MQQTPDLFFIYVGGKTETSLIEVHDIHFTLGEKIEDTYDQLRKQWWGTPKSLHLDAWGKIKCVDNYAVSLSTTPADNQKQKLFFINLGGYDPNDFTELHKNMLIVAEDEGQAKIKAKETVKHWDVPHKDYLYELDECINVNELLLKQGLSIHLKPTENPEPFKFTCKYVPIGR